MFETTGNNTDTWAAFVYVTDKAVPYSNNTQLYCLLHKLQIIIAFIVLEKNKAEHIYLIRS